VKRQPSSEIAGSPRNTCRRDVGLLSGGGRATDGGRGLTAYQTLSNSECRRWSLYGAKARQSDFGG
jgi:hypothetical protein